MRKMCLGVPVPMAGRACWGQPGVYLTVSETGKQSLHGHLLQFMQAAYTVLADHCFLSSTEEMPQIADHVLSGVVFWC